MSNLTISKADIGGAVCGVGCLISGANVLEALQILAAFLACVSGLWSVYHHIKSWLVARK